MGMTDAIERRFQVRSPLLILSCEKKTSLDFTKNLAR
jgi:hypothetical protein